MHKEMNVRRNLVIAIGLGLTLLNTPAFPALGQTASAPQVTAPDYAAAVSKLADELEQTYVDREVGKHYATMLRAGLAAGAYAGLADREAVSQRLTEDLRATHPDKHLRVRPEGQVARNPNPLDASRNQPRPPAIEDGKWVAEGVAYIKLNEFNGSEASLAKLEAFMRSHLDAKALILDARTHRGGGMAEMDVVLPYLYAKPMRLVTMDLAQARISARGGPPEEASSMRPAAAPPGIYRREHWVTPNAETRLRNAKVFYLTSGVTASAAEHLALALKRTHRAVLVGEPTSGANHFGGFQPIGAGLMAFLPVGRTFDPDTGKDWEGVGIQPDIAIPADQALDKALELVAAKG